MPGFQHSFPFTFGLITGSENPPVFPLSFPFAFGLVKGSVDDLAVSATISSDMSVVYFVDSDTQATVDLWSAVEAALVGQSATSIAADPSSSIGYGVDSDTAVTVGLTAESSAQLVIDAHLGVTASGTVGAGYGFRGTPTVEVSSTADTRLDALSESSLAGVANATGHIGFGVESDTAITVGFDAVMSVNRDIAANLNIGCSSDATPSRGSGISGALAVVSGVSGRDVVNSLFEADLGASAAGTASVRKTLYIRASAGVTALGSAGMSLGQAVQASLSSQLDVSGVQRKGQMIVSDSIIRIIGWSEPSLNSKFESLLDATADFPASMVVITSIESDLAAVVVFAARSQVGGTTVDRIVAVDPEVRIQVVDTWESQYQIPNETRSMTIESRVTE